MDLGRRKPREGVRRIKVPRILPAMAAIRIIHEPRSPALTVITRILFRWGEATPKATEVTLENRVRNFGSGKVVDNEADNKSICSHL